MQKAPARERSNKMVLTTKTNNEHKPVAGLRCCHLMGLNATSLKGQWWRTGGLILQPLTKSSNHIATLVNKNGGMWVGEILKYDPGRLRMKNYVIGFESRHTTTMILIYEEKKVL